MNGAEHQRLVMLNRVLVGDLTAAEAADALGRSVRQVRRMLAAYRKEGAAALAHGNRGRTPAHALDPALGQRVIDLARTTYAGCNDTHLSELLAEREGITVSRQRLAWVASASCPVSRSETPSQVRISRRGRARGYVSHNGPPC